ncbi:MAG: hypothetical protein AAGC60_23255 [Acidobacteriota bacterium]
MRKTIKYLPNADTDMVHTFEAFLRFLDPEVRWRGRTYRFDVELQKAEPLVLGSDLGDIADLVIDNGSHHWLPFFRNWAQSAVHSGVQFLNNGNTYRRLDKHACYDLLARALDPRDRLPTTVLLPEYQAYTADLEAEEAWRQEQTVIAEQTAYGHDPERAKTDWDAVRRTLTSRHRWQSREHQMRIDHYPSHDYLKDVVERVFGERFPLWLKPAIGFGGTDVSRIDSLDDLYRRFDRSRGAFLLQEGVTDYAMYLRCMAMGPQVLPIRFLPEEPHHLHYDDELPTLDAALEARLRGYVRFINAYHRWNHNSFEAVIQGDSLLPVDFTNACPTSTFLALRVHFPWLLCALVRWSTFVVVAEVDLAIDTEIAATIAMLRDPERSAVQKIEACDALAHRYFRIDEFHEFCRQNWRDLPQQWLRFMDENGTSMVESLIRASDFPAHEHDRFIAEYTTALERTVRARPERYLEAGVYS